MGVGSSGWLDLFLMKLKKHKFVITVTTHGSQRSALNALLSAFARRNPDGCSFGTVEFGAFQRRQHARIMKTCAESRKRMNGYTPEKRAELEAKARAIIDGSNSKQ